MAAERDWVKVVAADRCDECGLTTRELPRDDLPGMLADLARRWAVVLETAPGELTRRPTAGAWSALEYGAHVRDVLALFCDRIGRAVAEEGPDFEWWDHEAAAVEERYNDQDLASVARDLRTNAERLASAMHALGEDEWTRVGTRRRREHFTVEGLARFALHETHHHLVDALRDLR